MKAVAVITLLIAASGGCDGRSNIWDLTAGKSDICPVHGASMTKRQVEIIYGHPAAENWAIEVARLAGSLEAFRKEERDRFPFSGQPVFGSDEIERNSATKALILECPRCIHEFRSWLERMQANKSAQRNTGIRPLSMSLPAFNSQSLLGPCG